MAINTHNLECDFGRHFGVRYTRIPVSYLKWMINSNHSRKDVAQAELDRRGTVIDRTLEVSGHAIDRASTQCLDIWGNIRFPNEGLNTWLIRMATEALEQNPDKEKVTYQGMIFIFENDGVWPVLKTVMKR